MKKVDLHIHTLFSDDGELTPEEIIDRAVAEGMDVIAITDHNSVKGIQRALDYGKDKAICVLPGIEIDCTFAGINLHLLGYNIDFTKDCFEELENNILKQEQAVALEKINKIKEVTGLNLDREEVFKRTHNGIVTGELIAEVLLEDEAYLDEPLLAPYREGGSRGDMPFVNFYWDYFSQGKAAYIPMTFITLQEAIKMIKDAGGIPVIAHPGNNLKGNKDMIDELIKVGIEGIEVYSSYHTEEDREYFYHKAKEMGLIITCGTDFHGKNKPHINIGHFRDELKGIITF